MAGGVTTTKDRFCNVQVFHLFYRYFLQNVRGTHATSTDVVGGLNNNYSFSNKRVQQQQQHTTSHTNKQQKNYKQRQIGKKARLRPKDLGGDAAQSPPYYCRPKVTQPRTAAPPP